MASPSQRLFAQGFAADAQTERALRAGLAGREIKIQRARLATALRVLAAEPASRLVFVDVDGVSEPENAAKQLALVCAHDTGLVAIGSTDSARFGRTLMQHGVTDYLVKPLSPSAVLEASAIVVDGLPEHLYAGRIVTFAGNSGAGTSTLVAAVARAMATVRRSVSVVDLDPVSGKLSSLLEARPESGLQSLVASIDPAEVANTRLTIDRDHLDRISAPGALGISLIAYPPTGSPPELPSLPLLLAVLKHLANRTHVVLVAGATDPELQVEIMRQSDARVLLYEPSLPSVSAAVRQLAWLGTEGTTTLVECRTRMRRYALSPAHIRYAFAERRPDVVIPFEPALHAGSTGSAPGRLSRRYRRALDQVIEFVGGGNHV